MHALGNSFQRIARDFLSGLDTPRSLTAWLLIKHEEFSQLVNLSCDPTAYDDPEVYFRDAAATDFLRKMQGLPTGIDLESEALKAFNIAEKQCCLTNTRLKLLDLNWDLVPADLAVITLLGEIRKDIFELMGAIPQCLVPRHGPGATFGDRGHRTTPVHKMTSRPTMTNSFVPLLPLWGETLWSRGLDECHPDRSRPLATRGNRFSSVPKDAKKNRGIAIEPSLNVAYQLAVGSHLKARLSKWGIDLVHGQGRHQRLASAASRRGHLATIDLSSASDTVAYELVRTVLSGGWFDVLEALRSPMTLLPSGWHKLEKYSSMGNGFTFELETILFAAICRACARMVGVPLDNESFAVYGDDIIIPIELSDTVLAALRVLGFTPNPKKTFTFGHFRESCGGDFFRGYSVRPHFIEKAPTEPQDWIALANGIMRVQEQLAALGSAVSLFRAWEGCLHRLPLSIRTCFGPSDLGDAVINTTVESSWAFVTKPERPCVRYLRAFTPRQRKKQWRGFAPGPLLAGAVYGVDSAGYALRGGTSEYRIQLIPYS